MPLPVIKSQMKRKQAIDESMTAYSWPRTVFTHSWAYMSYMQIDVPKKFITIDERCIILLLLLKDRKTNMPKLPGLEPSLRKSLATAKFQWLSLQSAWDEAKQMYAYIFTAWINAAYFHNEFECKYDTNRILKIEGMKTNQHTGLAFIFYDIILSIWSENMVKNWRLIIQMWMTMYGYAWLCMYGNVCVAMYVWLCMCDYVGMAMYV